MIRSTPNWNSNHFVRAAAKSLPTVLRARGRDQFDRMQQFGDESGTSEVDTMMYWRGGICFGIWLANAGTLRKEFEKNKLGNIRLRTVPVQR